MSNRIDTGFIATGNCQRGNNYFTNNEVEDDFLNTQGENSPISTQPNLNFAQEPPPNQLSISASRREETQLICASVEKKSDRTAIHNEEFSVSAAVKTFEQLQGFSKRDFVVASTIFINNAGVREVFLSCNEENKAPWIKAMIDLHKAKQKHPREELEQDANQNQPQSKLVRRISSMENRRKRLWEELEQDVNQNQPQSKRVRLISSMENQPQSCQMQVGMIRIFKARKRPREELEQDANQNQPQSKRVRLISSMENQPQSCQMQVGMIRIFKARKRQYDVEQAVPTLQTQRLHIEELPTHKLVFANQVTQPTYTCKNITDKNKMPIEIQLMDINTGRQCTNVEGFNIKVKIVVIDGDLELEGLDSGKFNSKIIKEREGKRPLLVGNTEVTFNPQGVGTIRDIYFTDNSKWLRCGKFRLGACIDSKRCGTNLKIQEGLSKKFAVKDQRGLSYEKHYPPMFNDDVWRLEGIGKNGKYHQRLMGKNINNVQDFLKLLNENPIVLKEEILDMQPNTWKKVVEHVQTCCMEPDHANLENNADLPKSPELEPFITNPMPEFQQENMGVGKQVAPELNLVSDQLERFPSIASFNGNNEPKDTTEIPDLAGLELPGLGLLESNLGDGGSTSNQWDDDTDLYAFLDGGSTSNSWIVEALLINDDHAL